MKRLVIFMAVILAVIGCEKSEGTTPDGTPKPANNEIWYTNGSTTEATAPNKTDVFGVNIVSNRYDAEKECWVITFDGDVTAIGNWAFTSCNIQTVNIPDGVRSIGECVFQFCGSLRSATIGSAVSSIGMQAFFNCNSLQEVYCKATIPPSGGYNMFSNYDNGQFYPLGCTIYVPASRDNSIIKAYKAAENWSEYASYMVEYAF